MFPILASGVSWADTYKSADEIQRAPASDVEEHILAQVEEMMVLGCMALPMEKTLGQRKRYFEAWCDEYFRARVRVSMFTIMTRHFANRC